MISGGPLRDFASTTSLGPGEAEAELVTFSHEMMMNLEPSIARRRAVIAEVAAGSRSEADREICFFLLAGAHTSATAFVRTLHHVFAMAEGCPDDFDRACMDLAFLQPSSPIALRWALADVDLPGGVHVPAGARLTIDLMAVNRDREAFGADADAFDPHRELMPGIAPWGLSFGLGMHACIGQDLAAGLDPMGRPIDADHLYGLVPIAIRALLDASGRPDPTDPPAMDPHSTRGYWGRYPVVFPT